MMTWKTGRLWPLLLLCGMAQGQDNNGHSGESRPADVGIVYPLSTNGRASAQYSYSLALYLFTGVSGGIAGSSFAGLVHRVKGDAKGAVFAGIAQEVDGTSTGWQCSGLLNRTGGLTVGGQAAGLVNKASAVKGMQLAGLVNIADTIRGAQVAGLFNGARSSRVQIAGLFNKTGDVDGVQVAGLFNKARRVKGLQLAGLLNIADSSDYPLGLVNIIRNGQQSLEIHTDEMLNTGLAFRSGGRVLYGLVGVGMNLREGVRFYTLEAGIGARLTPGEAPFRLQAEAAQMVLADGHGNYGFKYSLRFLPEWGISPRLALFAGPSVNLLTDYADGALIGRLRGYPLTTTLSHHPRALLFAGASGGVRFIL